MYNVYMTMTMAVTVKVMKWCASKVSYPLSHVPEHRMASTVAPEHLSTHLGSCFACAPCNARAPTSKDNTPVLMPTDPTCDQHLNSFMGASSHSTVTGGWSPSFKNDCIRTTSLLRMLLSDLNIHLGCVSSHLYQHQEFTAADLS
jgi:hypothetical protein